MLFSKWHVLLAGVFFSLVPALAGDAAAQSLSVQPIARSVVSVETMSRSMEGLLLRAGPTGLRLRLPSPVARQELPPDNHAVPLLIIGALVGGPTVGAGLLTVVIGSIVAMSMERRRLAWGIAGISVGALGVVYSLLFLSLPVLAIPMMAGSLIAIGLGITSIALHVKGANRRRRRYRSQQQRTADAILAELSPAPAYVPSANGLAFSF